MLRGRSPRFVSTRTLRRRARIRSLVWPLLLSPIRISHTWRISSRRVPLTLIVPIGHTRIHSSSSVSKFFVTTTALRSRRSSRLQIGRWALGRHGRHGVRPLALRHHIVRGGGGPGAIATGRGMGAEYVGEGGVSLVARRRAVAALVVLVISHDAVLFSVHAVVSEARAPCGRYGGATGARLGSDDSTTSTALHGAEL